MNKKYTSTNNINKGEVDVIQEKDTNTSHKFICSSCGKSYSRKDTFTEHKNKEEYNGKVC